MRVSITVSGFSRIFANDLRAVLDAARAAGDAGIDQLVLPDHVVMGPRTDRYPFGTFPYPPAEPWPEPLTLLAAMAGVTERVRLATGILISPLRPAVLLAKTAATLDAVSGGRLDLGVGLGWQREEYEALGVAWADRFQVFTDQLHACVALWTRGAAGRVPRRLPFRSVRRGASRDRCSARCRSGSESRRRPATSRSMRELGAGWMPIHTTTREELVAGIAALPAGFEVPRRPCR